MADQLIPYNDTAPAGQRLPAAVRTDLALALKADVGETWVPEATSSGLHVTGSQSGARRLIDSTSGISNARGLGSYVTWERGGSSYFAPLDGSLAAMPTATNFAELGGWGSSTMQGFRAAIRAAVETRAGLTYFSGGVGGQGAANILARLGTRLARINAATIPASGPVSVTSSNMPSNAPSISIPGTLAGISGILAKESSATIGAFTFTRTTAGSATNVPAGTPFFPAEGPDHRASVTILNIGKNDLGANGFSGYLAMPELIAETRKAYDYVSGLGKHVLMMGHYSNPGTAADALQRRDVDIMNAFYATYGDRFLDLGGYVRGSAIWEHTGITPTSADHVDQAIGNLPMSLSSDGTHMIEAAYTAFVENVIVPRLNSLGWLNIPVLMPKLPSDMLVDLSFDHLKATIADGATITTVTAPGGTIQITLGSTPTAGTGPKLMHAGPGGHACLDFPDTDSWLSSVGSSSSPTLAAEGAARTVAVVVHVDDVTVNAGNFPKVISSGYNPSPNSYTLLAVNLAGTSRMVSSASGGTSMSVTGTENVIGKWVAILATCDAAGNAMIRTSKGTPVTSTIYPVGALLGLRLGAQYGTAPGLSGQLDGKVARALVWGRVLTAQEQSVALSVLAAEYGIT